MSLVRHCPAAGQNGYVLLDKSTGQPLGGYGNAQNAATYGGSVDAAEQNAKTAGTAAVTAGNTNYQNANVAYQNLKNNILPNITDFGNLLTTNAGGINPFSSQYANETLQAFQNQLSAPEQASFNATFQQLKNTIAQLAGAGGAQTPTANSAQSDGTLSPTSKMSTIQSTLNRIAQEGNIYLKNQGKTSNAALQQTQGGNSSSNGGYSGAYVQTSIGPVPTDY